MCPYQRWHHLNDVVDRGVWGEMLGGMAPCGGKGNGDHTYQDENFVLPMWCVAGVEGVGSIVAGVVVLHYLRHNEGVSCSTSFHMCGSWYFLSFLLRDGAFTQMYMASFIVLVTPGIPCPLW